MAISILALGAIAASPIIAQDTAPAAATPEIVVLGRGLALPPGTPAYGSVVIDRTRLTGDASGRVEDVLADVAGVAQYRRADSRSANPSAQSLTVRALGGNATSRALVLLDGVPIADPFFGSVPFTALSPERLGAVRITRGGGSGPFGAGAVAGTVELVSAGRSALPLVAGEAAYGSFNSVQMAGTISPDLGMGYGSVFGRYERSDGFYTTPPDERVAATARARFGDVSGGMRAVVPVGASSEVQASALLYDDHRTLRFVGATSAANGEDASIRFLRRGEWQIDALAYVQARGFSNRVISATTYKLSLDQRRNPATGAGGKIELRPPVGGDHVLRLGIDTRYAGGELDEEAYSAAGSLTTRRLAGGSSTTTGLFAEDDWTIRGVVLTGGGRVDRWTVENGFLREISAAGRLVTDNGYPDRAGTVPTGRVGALVHAAPALDLRAAAYTSFRVPMPNELYRSFVVFPVTTRANAALGLERLAGGEVGLELRSVAGATLSFTAYYNRLGGAIANVTIGPNLRERQNVDAIVAKGIEASASFARGPWSVNASYALNDSHVRATGGQAALNGLEPAQSPRHVASVTAAIAPLVGPSLSATVRYVGRQYDDDLQTMTLPPATTLDLVATQRLGHRVALIARAENVTDTAVVTRNSGGTIDLGTPRTLWVGVRLGR